MRRSECQRIAGGVNQHPWYKCRTHDFKLHPHAPPKFMGHGIAPIYAGIHSILYSEKICKHSQWLLIECDKSVTKSVTHVHRHIYGTRLDGGRDVTFVWRFCDKIPKHYSIPHSWRDLAVVWRTEKGAFPDRSQPLAFAGSYLNHRATSPGFFRTPNSQSLVKSCALLNSLFCNLVT